MSAFDSSPNEQTQASELVNACMNSRDPIRVNPATMHPAAGGL